MAAVPTQAAAPLRRTKQIKGGAPKAANGKRGHNPATGSGFCWSQTNT
jgi:hypothetical protein